MPLSNSEWVDVLDHMRRKVREVGLSDIDSQVTLDFQPTQHPATDFMRYFSSVVSAVKERSLSGYLKALDALQSSILTEQGSRIEGIEVKFIERDAQIYATDGIDLRQAEDFTSLLGELHSLDLYLRREGVVDE